MEYKLVSDSWGQEEIKAIKKVIKSGLYTYKGKYVKEFEKKFAKFFGAKYGVMVNSGSSANLLAIASLFFKKNNPLKKGDEVLVPAVAWSTTYHPLQQYNLKIRLVDINLNTLNCDVDKIINAVTKKTKAILAVSILGNPVKLDKLKKFCDQKKIYLIEDNCESMGATIKKKYTGTFGIVNTFSTFFSHHISTIEGGLILTDSNEIYELLLSLRSHGWTRENSSKFSMKKYQSSYEDYCFVIPGYNLRPNNIYAAVGLEQLKKLNKLLKIRRKNHEFFIKLFSNDKRFIIQKLEGNSSCFAFTFVFKPGYLQYRKVILNQLKKAKIEYRLITGGSFLKHPVKKYFKYSVYKNTKNADYIHDNGFFVGNHPKPLFKELNYLKKILS
jgi:CDP-6-deoxy-D-xylo-4-hexulose-3-dehydrase